MSLALSSDFHVNLQLIIKIILKRSTGSILRISIVWAGICSWQVIFDLRFKFPIRFGKGHTAGTFKPRVLKSGGSQRRCESGNDSASGPHENREGAFRMDEGIALYYESQPVG